MRSEIKEKKEARHKIVVIVVGALLGN